MLHTETAPRAERPPGALGAAPLAPIRSQPLQQLVDWWFEARGERLMPALGDVNPVAIPKTLTRIWLCDYLPESGRIRYRIAGDEINDFWGFNLAGRFTDSRMVPGRDRTRDVHGDPVRRDWRDRPGAYTGGEVPYAFLGRMRGSVDQMIPISRFQHGHT